MNLDPDELQVKLQITYKAAELYVRQDGTFTLNQIARETDLEVGEIFNYFPDKRSILEFYYISLILRYRMMIADITDFESYTLSEKLSNFVYASFDMVAEQRAFVDKSFNHIILGSYHKTEFEKEAEKLIRKFFETDPLVSASNQMMATRYLFSLLGNKYLWLIRFWLNDNSEEHELSMELTDKITALVQEMAYNSVIDKGIDLIKLIISNKVGTSGFAFINKITSKIEIR